MNAKPIAIVALGLLPACSLIVSLDGISDGPLDGGKLEDAPIESAPPPVDGGARELSHMTFEQGIVGPTGADDVRGVVTEETAAPLFGMKSARIRAEPANRESYLRETFEASANLVLSFLVRVHAWPTGPIRLVRIGTESVSHGQLRLRPDGRLESHNVPLKTSSPVLALETTYLVKVWAAGGANGSFSASVGSASGAEETTFATGSAPFESPTFDTLFLGQTLDSDYGMDITLDEVVVGSR